MQEYSLVADSCIVHLRWFITPSSLHVKRIVEHSSSLYNLNRFISYKGNRTLLDVYLGLNLCGGQRPQSKRIHINQWANFSCKATSLFLLNIA